MPVSRNQPGVIRKGFETKGIAKADTKELKKEGPFEDLVEDH